MLQTVQVAVSGATFHFDKLYTYLVPPTLAHPVVPGGMVLVPFGRGNKPRMGVVLAVGQQEEAGRCKELFDAAPENARLTEKIAQLRLVDRAKCLLIERRGMTEADAHRLIEKQAMDTRATRGEVATALIEEMEEEE